MKSIILKSVGAKWRGVFALREFNKGNVILRRDYSKVKKFLSAADVIGAKTKLNIEYYGNGKYIIGRKDSTWYHVNHSCNSNAFIKSLDKSHRAIVARCDIRKGEEVSINYNDFPNDVQNVFNDDAFMKCS